MKKPLIIIGAGSVGGYLVYNIGEFPEYEIIGILDDDGDKINEVHFGHRVIGKVDNIGDFLVNNLHVAICIHFPKIKQDIFERIKHLDISFPNFISPYAWVSKGVVFGKGNIIYPGVSINYGSEIEDFVIVNMNCALGHHAHVSSFSSLAPSVSFGGHTFIHESVDMGIGSSTKQGVSIGRNAIVGGNAMIVKDAESNSTVIGVPGKYLR